jgi:TrmH family RNA methyltransferase
VIKEIKSAQNPLIKEILFLQEKSRIRKKSRQFVIEGQREIKLALQSDYKLKKILFCDNIFNVDDLIPFHINSDNIIKINKEIYSKIAHRETTEGIIAIAETKILDLTNLKFRNKNPLIIVIEAIEKPGNIGAILRSADAANVDAVIIADPKTDLYNPNIIRSSIGCVFTNQIAIGTSAEIISFLNKKSISIYCAALSASKQYQKINFTLACAIVVGTESKGLSDQWLKNSTENVIIPMQGQIDSLNVSVSVGILIFEAKRQRNFL